MFNTSKYCCTLCISPLKAEPSDQFLNSHLSTPQAEQIQVNYKNFKRNPNQNAHSATFNKKIPLWKTDQYYTVKYFMLTVTRSSETCYWKVTGKTPLFVLTWRRGVWTWETTWGSRRHSRIAKLLAISTSRSMKFSCCSSGWQIAKYPRYMFTFQAISFGQLSSTWKWDGKKASADHSNSNAHDTVGLKSTTFWLLFRPLYIKPFTAWYAARKPSAFSSGWHAVPYHYSYFCYPQLTFTPEPAKRNCEVATLHLHSENNLFLYYIIYWIIKHNGNASKWKWVLGPIKGHLLF